MMRHSADYLDLVAAVVVAWQWLEMAAAAKEGLSAAGDRRGFYEAKLCAESRSLLTPHDHRLYKPAREFAHQHKHTRCGIREVRCKTGAVPATVRWEVATTATRSSPGKAAATPGFELSKP